jgi:hypothetical protein
MASVRSVVQQARESIERVVHDRGDALGASIKDMGDDAVRKMGEVLTACAADIKESVRGSAAVYARTVKEDVDAALVPVIDGQADIRSDIIEMRRVLDRELTDMRTENRRLRDQLSAGAPDQTKRWDFDHMDSATEESDADVDRWGTPLPFDGDDPAGSDRSPRDDHYGALLDSWSVATAEVVCHPDAWEFILVTAASRPGFRLPDGVSADADGNAVVSLSGRSVASVLEALRVRSIDDPEIEARAGAERIYKEVRESVRGLRPAAGTGARVRVTVDYRMPED